MENRRNSEVIFSQENISVILTGPFTQETSTVGTLLIIKEAHGYIVEWHPFCRKAEVTAKSVSETDHLDNWEHISVTPDYKAKKKESATENKSIGCQRSINFDVCDIKSFKRIDRVINKDKGDVIFTVFLKDGTSIPSFHFVGIASCMQFILELEKLVDIKRSKKDNTLFLVNDRNVEALEKSFSELELFDDNKTHIVTKFLQNPVETAMGGFSKVTNLVWGNFDYILHNEGSSGLSSEYSEEKVIEMLQDSLPDVNVSHHEETGFEFVTCIQLPQRQVMKREEPVTVEEWQSYFSSEGRVTDIKRLKNRIFKGGLMHSVRSEAWKFLLGYYSFHSSHKDREALKKQKVDDYYRMKLQWKSMTQDQESKFSAYRERRNLIGKDVNRTDRTHPFFEGDNNTNIQMLYDILMTYCMYNFDLGYVQGMSDLLSPILVVMQNEADAFWCFAQWMNEVGNNFELDQQGMKTQLQNLNRLLYFVDSQLYNYLEAHDSGNLYFAFRWLLILFKRDFKFQEIMRLWEVQWTGLPCKNFHLLICIAILDTEKLTIMENSYGLTEILKHINDLAYKINLDDVLCKAEAIYHQVVSCVHLSDIVQNILGIEIPLEPRKIEKPADKRVGNKIPMNSNSSINETSPDNNVEDLDSFVDLEKHYDISFGLFT